jgi:hypothetical protein
METLHRDGFVHDPFCHGPAQSLHLPPHGETESKSAGAVLIRGGELTRVEGWGQGGWCEVAVGARVAD